MAIFGVSITKSNGFRGVQQEFGNTYFYETPVGATDAVLNDLIDTLVTKEKSIHANTVSFLRAKCWSAGGTKAENQMRVQKNLTGTGSIATPATSLDRERAFLIRFRAGIDTRGNPVYLRKWLHLDVAGLGGNNLSSAAIQNTGQLDTTQRNTLVNWGNDIKSLTNLAQTFTLVSEKGRNITGDTVAHPYLEHHQLGDMWR